MLPEDKLDALLPVRRGPGVSDRQAEAVDDALAPFVDAADRLRPLRDARPRGAFAADLEERLLTRAAALRSKQTPATSPVATVETAAEHSAPIPPAPAPATVRTIGSARRRGERRGRLRVWQVAAAVFLLLLGGAGLFSAAAMAAPGSPLYALRRWEQNVRVSLDSSAADRVRLHIQYATDALDALQNAAAQHRGDPAYRDALNTTRAEDAAAAADLSNVPAGDEHNSLQAQVAALHDQERQAFYAALPLIGWPDRLATTQALGSLGAPVPVVTSARVERDGGAGGGWRVVVDGSGFAPGAALVVDGQPVGQVVSVEPGELVATIGPGDRQHLNGLVGVQNPDGTSAATTDVRGGESNDQETPGPVATPTHGAGDHGDNHGGDHGGKPPTPTPAGGNQGH